MSGLCQRRQVIRSNFSVLQSPLPAHSKYHYGPPLPPIPLHHSLPFQNLSDLPIRPKPEAPLDPRLIALGHRAREERHPAIRPRDGHYGFTDYEEDKKARLGADALEPKRMKHKKFVR